MATKNKTVLRCPHCGASNIEPDGKEGKLKCHSCMQVLDAKSANASGNVEKLTGKVIGEGAQNIIPDEDVILTLKCSSCGAEVVINTEEAMTASCPWCRHMLSVTEKLPNGAVPDLVLPFKLSRKDAFEKMRDFLRDRTEHANLQMISEFKEENIRGVFLPYVVIDMRVNAQMSGMGEELVRRYTVGSGDDQETRYDANLYKIERNFELEVDDLTIEASSDKLNHDRKRSTNNVISAIMPFDTENAVDWDPRYLRGYTSERRDLNIAELDRKAKNQTEDILKYQLSSTVKKYDRGICWDIVRLEQKGVQWKTAYLPVWLFSVVEVNKNGAPLKHYIAVNARTGETMGSVPIDKKQLLINTFGWPLLVFLVSRVLSSFKLSSPLLEGLSELFSSFGVFFIIGWIIGYGIYALMCVSKYRSTMARHNFESETRAKICNLKSEDELVEYLHGLRNSQIRDRNDNLKSDVDNSGKKYVDQTAEQARRQKTILYIVLGIMVGMFAMPIILMILFALML